MKNNTLFSKKHFFYISVFCFFICSLTPNLSGQNTDSTYKKHAVLIGFGNYEYVHAGYHFSIKQKHYAEMALGIKPWLLNSSNYQMAYFCLGTMLFKKKNLLLTPNVHIKFLLWHYNNPYNRFVVLGINPEFRITKRIKKDFVASINVGALYNSPIYYERKTYLEVGWPKEWQPSFSVQFFYFIK